MKRSGMDYKAPAIESFEEADILGDSGDAALTAVVPGSQLDLASA
jgi:hypothetical protein